jgi:arabinose-5-phosphate isomerase
MHTDDAIPIVPETAGLRDIVLEMTRQRLGMTTVVDGEGRLIGVITDGDLRRIHLRETDVTAITAAVVASRNPKLIAGDDLAAKALEAMEAFAITSLVVVDGDGRPRGVIHLHDILRAKIV